MLYEQEKQARMLAASNLQWEVQARRELEQILVEKRILAQDGRERLGYTAGPTFEATAREELELMIQQRRAGQRGSMRY